MSYIKFNIIYSISEQNKVCASLQFSHFDNWYRPKVYKACSWLRYAYTTVHRQNIQGAQW